MQRRRFYAPPADDLPERLPSEGRTPKAVAGARLRLSPEESHHLLRVLRLSRGDEIYTFDGCGGEFRCRLSGVEGKMAVVEIIEPLTDRVESPLPLTLAQALAKGEKFDLVVQKATELGVRRIVPLVTEQTDVKLKDEQTRKRLERWQRISLEAVKQCGRRQLVEITEPVRLNRLLEANATAGSPVIYFNERGGALLNEALGGLQEASPVTVVVGPEGGWSDAEIALFQKFARHGCTAVSLGQRILRTETAAIVAVALVQHRFGDLSR